MKKIFFISLFVFIYLKLFCQDIIVDFSGRYENSAVNLNSVLIENETQGTSITIFDNFSVNLTELTSDITKYEATNKDIITYPNPFSVNTKIEFSSNFSENVEISISNITGQTIYFYKGLIFKGRNRITFSSNYSGLFILSLKSENLNFSKKVFCLEGTETKLKVNLISENSNITSKSKELFYNIGDRLKFTGFYNDMKTVITASPTSSCSYEFDFYECKDFDQNNYSIVKIGEQWWTAENIKSTHYSDGTALSDGTNAGNIENNFTSKYYFFYNNSSSHKEIYGLLYTWKAVMNNSAPTNENPSNVQGICPNGWHIPSESEWDEMRDYLDGWESMHGKVKSVGTELWISPNDDATNESGLSIIPGGIRFDDGDFQYLNEEAFFWNTFGDNNNNAARGYSFFSTLPSESYYIYTFNLYNYGQSVRCVKN